MIVYGYGNCVLDSDKGSQVIQRVSVDMTSSSYRKQHYVFIEHCNWHIWVHPLSNHASIAGSAPPLFYILFSHYMRPRILSIGNLLQGLRLSYSSLINRFRSIRCLQHVFWNSTINNILCRNTFIVYNYKDVELFFFLKKRLVTDYYCDVFIVSPLQFHRVE